LFDGWRTSLSGGQGDGAHTGTQSRSMLCVVRKLVRSEIYAPHCRLGPKGRYLPDDTVQFVSLTHIVAKPRRLENNNYRMIRLTIRTIMLRDSVFRHGVLTGPVCTITAVSKDLVRRADSYFI